MGNEERMCSTAKPVFQQPYKSFKSGLKRVLAISQGFVNLIIIINNLYKALFSNISLTALYKHLMMKTTLTYISDKQNLKYCCLPLLPIKQ